MHWRCHCCCSTGLLQHEWHLLEFGCSCIASLTACRQEDSGWRRRHRATLHPLCRSGELMLAPWRSSDLASVASPCTDNCACCRTPQESHSRALRKWSQLAAAGQLPCSSWQAHSAWRISTQRRRHLTAAMQAGSRHTHTDKHCTASRPFLCSMNCDCAVQASTITPEGEIVKRQKTHDQQQPPDNQDAVGEATCKCRE